MVIETKTICDKEIYDYVTELIKNAKKSIIITSPWIYGCKHLIEELDEALDKGINFILVTRPISQNNSSKDQEKLINYLKSKGANTKTDEYLHGKVVIADHNKMVISSSNLVEKSLLRNHEIGIYSNDPNLIEPCLKHLEKRIIGEKLIKTFTKEGNILHKIWELRFSKDPKDIDTLMSYLNSKNANYRRIAASTLGQLSKFKPEIYKVVPQLIFLLKDERPQVKSYSAIALGRIGDPRAIPYLEGLLNDQKWYVKESAKKSLDFIKRIDTKTKNDGEKICIKCNNKFKPKKDFYMYCDSCYERYSKALENIEKDPLKFMESINPLGLRRIRENMKKVLSKKKSRFYTKEEKEKVLDEIRKIESR